MSTEGSSANKSMVCPYSRKCGGCEYIDKPYKDQLEIKQKSVNRVLGPLAHDQNCKIEHIIGADHPEYYRNKVHSVFSRTVKGKIIRGIYREDSHEVVDVSGCRLENRTADAIIEEIKNLLPSFKLKVYDEDTGYGWLRHVLVRVGQLSGKANIMVVLVTSEVQFNGKNNFIRVLRNRFPEISTIVQNINNKRTSMVLGERSIVLFGKGYIEDDSLGLKFRVSCSSFFQVNPEQTRRLYGLAAEMAGLTGSERVLDAYCGTGTIGMFLAGRAHSVVGVELNGDAVKDAVSNARANGIKNITFIKADATQYMRSATEGFDLLCMDPPRSGSTPEFIEAASNLGIPKIVYVSCNPQTLDTDLKLFIKHGYVLKRLVPVDMFPATEHVETVVLMSKFG